MKEYWYMNNILSAINLCITIDHHTLINNTKPSKVSVPFPIRYVNWHTPCTYSIPWQRQTSVIHITTVHFIASSTQITYLFSIVWRMQNTLKHKLCNSDSSIIRIKYTVVCRLAHITTNPAIMYHVSTHTLYMCNTYIRPEFHIHVILIPWLYVTEFWKITHMGTNDTVNI